MLRICQKLIRILKCFACTALPSSFFICFLIFYFCSSLFSAAFAGRLVYWSGAAGIHWSDNANWHSTPPGMGNQSDDVAVFSDGVNSLVVNDKKNISLQAMRFDGHQSGYFIKNTGLFTFTGAGVVNNSAVLQRIDNDKDLYFKFASDAGSETEIINGMGGIIKFSDESSANNAIIYNEEDAKIDISGLTLDEIVIGQLSGKGEVVLGNKTISIGHLNKDSEISGIISGEGGLKKIGQGTLTLTGNNTYQGKTLVESGILQLGNKAINGSVNGNNNQLQNEIFINKGAKLILSDTNDLRIEKQICGEGDFEKAGEGRLIWIGKNSTGAIKISQGVFQLGDGKENGSIVGDIVDNAKLDFHLSSEMSYNGEITGLGSVEINDAMQSSLTLNGVNRYQGDTTINSGRLLVGDFKHPNAELTGKVTVNPTAILGGFGKIQGDVHNAGTIAAGASIGTLTIEGDYTQAANGELFTEIRGDQSDLIRVNGVAQLAGTLKIGLLGGFDPHAVYTVLTAEGGLVGRFDNVDGLGELTQYFLRSQVNYGVNQIQISTGFNEQAFKNAVKTPNQQAIADYILVTGGNSALQYLVGNLASDKQFRSAMEQIAATVYANEIEALNYSSAQFSSQLIQRFPANDGDTIFWATPYGTRSELASDENGGLKSELFGMMVGAQSALTQTVHLGVGFAFSTFSANATGDENAKVDGELYQFGVYGLYQIGNFMLNASVDFGKTSDLTTQRQITYYQALENNPTTTTVVGSYSAILSSQQFQLRYFLKPYEFVQLRPFAGIAHRQVSRPAFTESSDEGFALSVESSSFDLWQSQLGLYIDVPVTDTLSLVGSVAWQHQLADTNDSTTANITGLDHNYTVEGVAVGRDAALIKAGFILLDNHENLNVAAFYEGEFAQSWNDNALKLQMSFVFA